MFIRDSKVKNERGEYVTMTFGDPVPKQLFREYQLENMWDSGRIGIAVEKNTEEGEPTVLERGRGWFHVTFPDGESVTVRGKQKLEELLASRVPAGE